MPIADGRTDFWNNSHSNRCHASVYSVDLDDDVDIAGFAAAPANALTDQALGLGGVFAAADVNFHVT